MRALVTPMLVNSRKQGSRAMAVCWAYLGFLPLAALCFWRLPLRIALLLVLIGGWWLLPVASYPPGASGKDLPWWITGIALPSDMLVTKAWIPPTVALAGAMLRDPVALRSWRPAPIDAPIALWCLWPLAQSLWTASDPSGAIAALYLAGAWGLPWVIGRVWLGGPRGREGLLQALALSGLANVPVAIVEGMRPPMLYGLLYGPHPFRFDGIERYVGYRPIGFMEDGNLYGLWAALAAFAAIALVRREDPARKLWTMVAIIDVAVALASQSVGAIILSTIGLVLLAIAGSRFILPLLGTAGALMLLVAVVHLSGIVPVQALRQTPEGEHLVGLMRSLGRGSFFWRILQDARSLPTIAAHPLIGTGQWDWWRQYGTRPWGQALLLIGQFGAIGLALCWGSLLAPSVATLRRISRDIDSRLEAALAILILVALADAALNAFFFYPAIVAAGAIAARPKRPRRESSHS